MNQYETFIRQSAIARGIDPDVAVRVAMSEGGVTDPVRQSDIVKNGVREPSYGFFQLNTAGGLGKLAAAQGIDVRDPNQWQKSVDFALDYAKGHGWGSWMGAKRVGINPYEGIGGGGGGGGGGTVREDPRRDTPSTGHPVGSTLNQPPAATTAAPAVAPVSSIADVAAARELSNPWAGLASGLASSVAPPSGLSEPDMAQLPPPTTDFTSAAPAAAAPSGQPGGEIGTLADLFKLGDIGQAASLRNVDRLGQPLIKRQYG